MMESKLTELNKTQKYDLCIEIMSILKEYLKADEAASFVDGALQLCRAWNNDHSLDIAVELYHYLDGEEQSLALYEESEEDEKMKTLWNCMIDAVAYICRGAFEAQGAVYFPEPIELVDDSLLAHLEESFRLFNG